MLDVMMKELREATEDFYNMTGIKIVLFDETRRHLYSYPETMCSFCSAVRSHPELTSRCLAFDNVGFDACERTHKPYIYRCHMGLIEAMTPICEGDVIIGYMMIGQVLCEGTQKEVEVAMRRASEEFGVSLSRFEEGLREMKCVSRRKIQSALHVMTMCVCYLYANQIIRSGSEDLSVRLRQYVERHYAEEINVPMLCSRMYLSKSKLYHLSLSAFGMGVSDYVRLLRHRRAKELLEEGRLSVAEIAQTVGYGDANYFTRVFKAMEGMTPTEYRRAAPKGDVSRA